MVVPVIGTKRFSHLQKDHSTILKTFCPICNSINCIENGQHTRWHIPLYRCHACSHVFAYDSPHDSEPDTFSTNHRRADFYTTLLQPLRIKSVADIGTPRDFYFLSQQHRLRQGIRCFAVDLYDKDCPPFVEFHKSLSTVKAELCTAMHVLEHVPNVIEFRDQLMKACKWFVLEVPHCETDEHIKISSGEPHVHFFTKQSLEELFRGFGCVVEIRYGIDMPKNRSVLVAHRLPFTPDFSAIDTIVYNRRTPKDYFWSVRRWVRSLLSRR